MKPYTTPFISFLVIACLFIGCKTSDEVKPGEPTCYPLEITYTSSSSSGVLFSFEFDDKNRLSKATSGEEGFVYSYDVNNRLIKMQQFHGENPGNDHEYTYHPDGRIDRHYRVEKMYYEQYIYEQGKLLPTRSELYYKDVEGMYQKMEENYAFEYDDRGNLVKMQLFKWEDWVRDDEFTYDNNTPFFKYIPQFIWFYAVPMKPEWAVNNVLSQKVTEIYPFPGGAERTYNYSYSFEFNEEGYPSKIVRSSTLSTNTTIHELEYNCK